MTEPNDKADWRGGLLGIFDEELKAKAFEQLKEPVPRPTAEQEREIEDKFDRLIEAGKRAMWEKHQHSEEADHDRFMRARLEEKYALQILSRAQCTLETTKTYARTFKHFAAFCKTLSDYLESVISPLPARVGIVGCYLDEEIAAGASLVKIRRLVAAISWAHRHQEHHDPTEHEIVKAIVRSLSDKVMAEKRAPLNGSAEAHAI